MWKTTSAVSPDFDGNFACKMLLACCDGVLPAVNLFSKWVPTTWDEDRDADDGQDPESQDGPAAVVTGAGQAPEDGVVPVLDGREPGADCVLAPSDRCHVRDALRFITDEL